ncbi:hypothetical protein GGF46_000934 [Coemansia sp. RSA 552]|nr:hypothetical protein GGF46_000934 [Coemansia sp. RSA 552]
MDKPYLDTESFRMGQTTQALAADSSSSRRRGEGPVFGPLVMAGSGTGDEGDELSDAEKDNEPGAGKGAHYWRSRPPLLPQRMATLVSTVSGATRLSLEITSLFWESIFDTISESTSSGWWFGSAAFGEAKSIVLALAGVLSPLASLNPQVVSRVVGSSSAAGYSLVSRSISATESLVEGGFSLYTRAVNVGIHAAGEYVRLIDAIFGSTDTSRVLASFVHMCRREAVEKNPEIRALIKEHGVISFFSQVMKTVVAWICLQVVTHGRSQPYRLIPVYKNTRPNAVFCPRRFISATGEPLQTRSPSLQPQGTPDQRSPALAPMPLSPLPSHGSQLQVLVPNDACSRYPHGLRRRSATIGGAEVSDNELHFVNIHDESSDEERGALSDQEGSFRDSEWDQRLVEALQRLTASDSSSGSEDAEATLGRAASGKAGSQPRSKSSIWNTLNSMRGANTYDAEDSSSSDDGSAPSAISRGVVFPAFASAPASLTTSPQSPNIMPQIEVVDSGSRPGTAAESIAGNGVVPETNLDHRLPSGPGYLPPPITPIVEPPAQDLEDMQQEFPRKPLLFNLARFISIASSAYGKSFMHVIGLDRGMIDARALIDAFGDDDTGDSVAATARTSRSNSVSSSVGQAEPDGLKPAHAQPMSSYHVVAAEPTALTDAEHHSARSPRSAMVSGRRATVGGRRPRIHHSAHSRRPPVSEHPNHYFFSQHTGIPLSDLLFSSYVLPIVPGVSKAANAKASAVERKLRHKRSLSSAASAARKQPRVEGANTLANDGSLKAKSPIETAETKGGGWLPQLPSVGAMYQKLPSPIGIISRVLGGGGSSGNGAANGTAPADRGKASTPPEPTPSQFRRFDKFRKRLVYRNPSIHALVHYIAVDHATRSVVLACRGTLGISDLFIDMICEYETVRLPDHAVATGKHPGFRVHSGMWHSALLLADASSEVFKEVAEALRLYPEYGLVITGHSLGGGVASLLTLLWSQPRFSSDCVGTSAALPPRHAVPGSILGSHRQFVTTSRFGLVTQRPIHCYSFGSPCSTNAALSYYCRGLVTSVANTDDFVSFLSIGACVDILNISAVLSRERGVAEQVMRRFLSAQRSKISASMNPFNFDFSRLRAYEPDSDAEMELESEDDGPGAPEPNERKWDYRTTQSNPKGVPKSNRRRPGSPGPSQPPSRASSSDDEAKSSLDDWHLSLVKTLRANMDSEKLYPPGDVFILASPGDDKVADGHFALPKVSDDAAGKKSRGKRPAAPKGPPDALPVGLFYCPDVAERFCELRFTRNMIVHHLPSTYERKLSALVHDTLADTPEKGQR